MTFDSIDLAVRSIVVVALMYATAVAATHWAVRTRRLSPFGRWPRLMRRLGDPVVTRMERRVIQSGGSPQNAPFWLLAVVVAAGLVLLSLLHWLIGVVGTVTYLADAGPRAWVRVVVAGLFWLLMTALFVRVIASWIGISLYNRWMRPVVRLTDWLLDPIRRMLPPFGIFDLSPMVAYLVLWLARGIVLGVL